MDFIKKYSDWILALIIVLILAGSLPFKFTGHPMPIHIFDVVGTYLGLEFMRTHGAVIIGLVELVCCILVLIPAARAYGGVLTAGTMAGAIFFHLFSPLGVTVHFEENGQMFEDGTLFYTAIIAFICGLSLAWKHRQTLPIVGKLL